MNNQTKKSLPAHFYFKLHYLSFVLFVFNLNPPGYLVYGYLPRHLGCRSVYCNIYIIIQSSVGIEFERIILGNTRHGYLAGDGHSFYHPVVGIFNLHIIIRYAISGGGAVRVPGKLHFGSFVGAGDSLGVF